MKKLFEFTIDFVLSGLLLGIIATSFLLTYNLTPVAQKPDSPVLGATTEKPIPLTINPKVKATVLDDHNQEFALKVDRLDQGESTFVLANVINNSNQTESAVLTTKIPKLNLNGVRYDLVINGTSYLIYDDHGDKQVRDLKLDIKAGESVNLNLKITAYSPISYAADLTAQLNY